MKPKVLMVDDDVDFTELLHYNLKQRGWEIHRFRKPVSLALLAERVQWAFAERQAQAQLRLEQEER